MLMRSLLLLLLPVFLFACNNSAEEVSGAPPNNQPEPPAKGTLENPIDISQSINNGQSYSATVDEMNSYYTISGLTADTKYFVALSELSSDADLAIYSDNTFTTLLCQSNLQSTAADSCIVTIPASGELFINVNVENTSISTAFTITGNEPNFSEIRYNDMPRNTFLPTTGSEFIKLSNLVPHNYYLITTSTAGETNLSIYEEAFSINICEKASADGSTMCFVLADSNGDLFLHMKSNGSIAASEYNLEASHVEQLNSADIKEGLANSNGKYYVLENLDTDKPIVIKAYGKLVNLILKVYSDEFETTVCESQNSTAVLNANLEDASCVVQPSPSGKLFAMLSYTPITSEQNPFNLYTYQAEYKDANPSGIATWQGSATNRSEYIVVRNLTANIEYLVTLDNFDGYLTLRSEHLFVKSSGCGKSNNSDNGPNAIQCKVRSLDGNLYLSVYATKNKTTGHKGHTKYTANIVPFTPQPISLASPVATSITFGESHYYWISGLAESTYEIVTLDPLSNVKIAASTDNSFNAVDCGPLRNFFYDTSQYCMIRTDNVGSLFIRVDSTESPSGISNYELVVNTINPTVIDSISLPQTINLTAGETRYYKINYLTGDAVNRIWLGNIVGSLDLHAYFGVYEDRTCSSTRSSPLVIGISCTTHTPAAGASYIRITANEEDVSFDLSAELDNVVSNISVGDNINRTSVTARYSYFQVDNLEPNTIYQLNFNTSDDPSSEIKVYENYGGILKCEVYATGNCQIKNDNANSIFISVYTPGAASDSPKAFNFVVNNSNAHVIETNTLYPKTDSGIKYSYYQINNLNPLINHNVVFEESNGSVHMEFYDDNLYTDNNYCYGNNCSPNADGELYFRLYTSTNTPINYSFKVIPSDASIVDISIGETVSSEVIGNPVANDLGIIYRANDFNLEGTYLFNFDNSEIRIALSQTPSFNYNIWPWSFSELCSPITQSNISICTLRDMTDNPLYIRLKSYVDGVHPFSFSINPVYPNNISDSLPSYSETLVAGEFKFYVVDGLIPHQHYVATWSNVTFDLEYTLYQDTFKHEKCRDHINGTNYSSCGIQANNEGEIHISIASTNGTDFALNLFPATNLSHSLPFENGIATNTVTSHYTLYKLFTNTNYNMVFTSSSPDASFTIFPDASLTTAACQAEENGSPLIKSCTATTINIRDPYWYDSPLYISATSTNTATFAVDAKIQETAAATADTSQHAEFLTQSVAPEQHLLYIVDGLDSASNYNITLDNITADADIFVYTERPFYTTQRKACQSALADVAPDSCEATPVTDTLYILVYGYDKTVDTGFDLRVQLQ